MSSGKANFDEFNGTSLSSPIAVDGTDCPSDDILLFCHRAKLPRKKRKEVIRHISQCKTCAQKSTYIRDILKEENQLIHEIHALMPRNMKDSKIGRRFPFISPSLFTPRTITATVIILLISISLILKFIPAHRPPTIKRNSSKIENFEMAYGLIRSALLFQKWKGIPDSRYYFSEIIDSRNDLRWEYTIIESFSLHSPSALSTRSANENNPIIIYAISDILNVKSNRPGFTLIK